MSTGLMIAATGFGAIGFATSLIMCAWMKRTGVVDAPDGDRKTQAAPVPRLGGVAIATGAVLGSLLGFVILIASSGRGLGAGLGELSGALGDFLVGQAPLLAFVIGAFLLGLWDDIWTANTAVKLLALTGLSVAVSLTGLVPSAMPTPFGEVTFPLVLMIGSAAWLLVFTNAVNFMDGSDGLAIGAITIMLLGLASIGTVVGEWGFSVFWFALFGAIAGFLLHNLRGTLYAGDAGALGLGALFAGLAVTSGLNVWTIATLALPFLVDVLMTLIWRAKHGRNWLQPHTDHAYQRMIAQGWSHLDTAIFYWGLSATCGGMAYIAAQGGGAAPFAVFWGLCLAGIVLWIWHRRAAK